MNFIDFFPPDSQQDDKEDMSDAIDFIQIDILSQLPEKKDEKFEHKENKKRDNPLKLLNRNEEIKVDVMNIFLIHDRISEELNKRYQSCIEYKKLRERLQWIQNNSQNKLEKIRAQKQLFKTEKLLKAIDDKKQINSYLREVTPLLNTFKELNEKERKFVIDPIEDIEDIDSIKSKIFQQYIIIAQKYVNLSVPLNLSNNLICDQCNKRDFDIVDESLYTCKNCGNCMRFFEETHSFKDVDRINLSSRYKYTRKTHFKDALYNRTGQNMIIDDNVYKDLKNLINKYHIEVKKLTKDTVEMLLIENGYEKLRDYSITIHSVLTGKMNFDISQIENRLLDMFDQLEEVLPDILSEYKKVNSINVEYKILKLQQLLGIQCSREDFDIHKDKLLEYDEIWQKACEKLNWRFIPTL